MKQKLYSKLSEEQNFRKVVESLYIFLATRDELQKYVEMIQLSSSENSIHHYNIEILSLFGSEM